jgi:hypothetical protein
MKTLLLTLLLTVSSVALGQSAHDSDVTCQKFEFLRETACTFGDGSGEVITDDSVSHHSAEQWAKLFPALVKADADAGASRVKKNEEAFARVEAESAKQKAKLDAEIAEEEALSHFTLSRDKKGCLRAGYAWQQGTCVSKVTK